MTEEERKEIKAVRKSYGWEENTKLEELKRLDEKVKRPSVIAGLSIGLFGGMSAAFGICMCCGLFGGNLPFGIILTVIGAVLCLFSIWFSKHLLASGKKKYGAAIVALSDELLNE